MNIRLNAILPIAIRPLVILLVAAFAAGAAAASTTKAMPVLPTGAAAPAPPADPDHFTFVTAGDNRSTGYGYPMPDAFDVICTQIGLIQPDFVVWTGDVIEGYGDSVADANAEYDAFLAGVKLTGVPVYNAPGNHEFSLDARLMPVYTSRMAPLYGSFDYGNSHFVIVNTNAVWPDGTIHDGSIDAAQQAWLESDLAANQSATNIFVFMHHYPFGPPDPDNPDAGDTGWDSTADRDAFHQIMVKYHVRAVFSSHNHIYYHTVKDGIDYYVSGGAGAPLDASPDQGGFLHYLVVHVDGARVTTTILQPWHLDVTYPEGDSPRSRRGHAWIANTEGTAVTVKHLVFHLASLPAGQTYAVTASVRYKVNSKPTDASIVSVTPSADGKSCDVVVSTKCPKSRTTEVFVAPATATGG